MHIHRMETPFSAGRWPVLTAGLAMQASLGALFSWKNFPAMATDSGGGGDATAIAPIWYSLVFFLIGTTLASSLLARLGPRTLATAGGSLLVAGFLLAGTFPLNPGFLVIGCGVLGGLGAGLAYLSPSAALFARFPERKGVMAVALVGAFVAGTVAFTPLKAAVLGGESVQAASRMQVLLLGMALAWLGIVVGGAQIATIPIDREDTGRQWRPWRVAIRHPRNAARKALWAMRSWLQWSAFFAGTAVCVLSLHQTIPAIPLPQEGGVWSSLGVVACLMLLLNAIGLATWRWISRRRGNGIAVLLFFLTASGISLASFGSDASVPQLLSVVCVVGFAGGALLSAMPSLRAQMLSAENLVATFGAMIPAYGLSTYLPQIWLVHPDRSDLSNYIMFGVGAVLIVGFLYLLFRPTSDAPADAT